MKTSIIYSGFYDAPLAFVVRHGGKQILFWRVFNDELDDYPDAYQVFTLPGLTEKEIAQSWQSLPEKAMRRVGEVLVRDVHFDETKRREIDAAVLDALFSPSEAVHA